jgi:CheY-like chemotaxis protein/HPt (histidine-containing phosphotransfer) domain-containing protein
MIVEDNAAARRAARGYLEAWGCTVMEAAEAQAALTALRSAAAAGRPAAVALIDQRMSGMDGWQLAGEIRRDAELSATRLVLISPAGMGAVEAKMRLLGWFAAYLTKPLKPRELAAALVGGPALEEVEELAPVPDAPKAEDQVVSAAGDVRVLIAEDHAVNREMFRVVLRRCGCEVVATEDGEKALQAAGAGRFDLIFLDLQMPNLPGLEATRRLRGIGVQAPIIGMSASVLSQEREQCRAAGMNGFLAKPFGLKEVQEVLARYLPARGAAQSGAAADDPPADGVFDAAEALAACLGDREALAGLLETFLSRLAEQQAAIRAALDSGGPAAGPAWQAAARAEAHSIKGAALNLCAGELAEQAGALERLAAAGHWKQAAEMFPQLEAAARRFRERAQRHGGTL